MKEILTHLDSFFDNQFRLNKSLDPNDHENVWIQVGDILDVHIRRTDEGVVVDIWGGQEETEPITSTWALFNESKGDEHE